MDAPMGGASDPSARRPGRSRDGSLMTRLAPDRLAGALIALLGAWILWQAFAIPQGSGVGAVGPRVFPIIVALGILASGVAMLLSRQSEAPEALPGEVGGAAAEALDDEAAGAPAEAAAEAPADWATLGGIAALLAVYLAAFVPLGFPIASALFLVAGARVLGSRAWLRDLVAGVLVSLAAYVVFTSLLGLELPGGPLEEPLRALFGEAIEE
jgi:putative tricarboxylic transport membrane protein